MKKIQMLLALLMTAVCLLTCLPTVMANDANPLRILGEVKSASRGDTLTYEIRASQSGRIYPASVHVRWTYDTSVFTLEKAELGNLYFEQFEEYFPSVIDDDSYEGFIYSEAKDGILLTLTFKVNTECDTAVYPIEIDAEYYNDETITSNPLFLYHREISSKYNCYSVMTENGSVTINDHVYGTWMKHSETEHKRTCTICTNIEYAPHTWNQGEVKKAASCISEGLKVYTCKDCGATKDEVLPKTADHVYGAWKKHNETEHKRSCECGDTQYAAHTLGKIEKYDKANHQRVCECGYTEYIPHSFGAYSKHDADHHKQVCGCGETLYTTHSWDAGKTTKPAQHLEEGIYTYTCTVCSELKNEAIPKTTVHNYGAWQPHDAEQHKRVCKCGETDYADHAWNAGEVTKPATNTENGIYTYTCTVCGATKTEEILKFEGSQGLKFRGNGDGTFSVSGIGTCTDTDIVIPTSTPDGAKVTGIWRNAFKETNIKSVKIPVGITFVEKWAFRDCKYLTSITFSGGLNTIAEAAFQGCTALASVTIPSGVTAIPKDAFKNCTSLVSVTLPNGITVIGNAAFSGCAALTSIKIPASVTAIETNAFLNCTSLKKLTLSEGPETIGTSAFQNCKMLTAVSIPSGVKTIEDSAFSGCESLKTLTFSEGLTEIGSAAFENCESLTVLVLPNTLETLGSSAFSYCTALTEVILSENLKTLGSYCFVNCRKITRVVLPKGMTSVGTDVWSGCKALSEIFYLGTPAEYSALAMTFPTEADVYYYAENKPEAADGNDYWHYENGEIAVWVLYIRGDMDGDGEKTPADAIYLLRHTIMDTMYPVVQSADVNGDGHVNSTDAIYLLRHIIMPSMYPLA